MRCRYFFFFNDTATTEIYTLSLHDALPISVVHHDRGRVRELRLSSVERPPRGQPARGRLLAPVLDDQRRLDRKSTRLNSSHGYISYAVFCLKKKKNRDNATCKKYPHKLHRM